MHIEPTSFVASPDDHPLDKLKDPILFEKFSLGIKKLFSGSFFSVCDLDYTLGLINPAGMRVAYDTLRSLHCENWSNMSGNMKAHVLQTLAVGMVYSPILEVLDHSVGEEELKEAQLVLKSILHPSRSRATSSLEDKTVVTLVMNGSSIHCQGNDDNRKPRSILSRLLRRNNE